MATPPPAPLGDGIVDDRTIPVTDAPLVGPLLLTSFWEGLVDLPALGGTLAVGIESPEGPGTGVAPSAAQLAVLRDLAAAGDGLRAAVQAGVVGYYEDEVDSYREALGPDLADIDAPELETPEEIWLLLSPPTLFVPASKPDGVARVQLLFECTWDEENGLGVALEDGAVHDVGYHEDVLFR